MFAYINELWRPLTRFLRTLNNSGVRLRTLIIRSVAYAAETLSSECTAATSDVFEQYQLRDIELLDDLLEEQPFEDLTSLTLAIIYQGGGSIEHVSEGGLMWFRYCDALPAIRRRLPKLTSNDRITFELHTALQWDEDEYIKEVEFQQLVRLPMSHSSTLLLERSESE